MSDSKNDLWEALQELSDIQEDIQAHYDKESKAFWNTLSKEQQMFAFYVVVQNLVEAELKDNNETYRKVIYERFEFPLEGYQIGMMSGYMQLHNSIIRPSEQAMFREFCFCREQAKSESPKKELIIDPPEGWKHGFPKIIPSELIGNSEGISSWLIKNGYPEEDIDLALKHSRYWEREV